MWEIRVSSGLAFKATPPMRLLFIPQRKKPAWQAQVSFNLLLFSPQVRTRVLEISPFALTNPRRCLLCRLQRLCLGPFVGGN